MPKKTSKKVPAKSGIQTRHATLPQSARASAIASSRARSRPMIQSALQTVPCLLRCHSRMHLFTLSRVAPTMLPGWRCDSLIGSAVWSTNLVEILCERLRRTTVQISEVALLELPVRLAKALLRLTKFVDHTAEPIKLSQRELGNIVGATRESVNKCMREWQRSETICD